MVNKLTGSTSVGSGADTLALYLSEDAYLGDAQFTVSVDGIQIGGTQTVTAIHGSTTQEFDILGTFAAGSHTVTVNYLNDYYDASGDRNLYVDSATIDGTVVPGAALNEYSGGPQSFSFVSQGSAVVPTPPITFGTGPDDLTLNISEDAYQGDARFRLSVDGKQVGPIQTMHALHASGAHQEFDVRGTFGPGRHSVGVRFLNGLNGGSPTTDRSLYVDSAALNGVAIATGSLSFHDQGAQGFSFARGTTVQPPPATVTIGTGSDVVALQVTEDAYQGDAQFTVTVDGTQIGGTQTAQISRSSSKSQEFDVKATSAPGRTPSR